MRGRVEAALGRRDAAAEAFARALEHIEPLDMPYERALIEFAHGQFLRRNGQPARRRRRSSPARATTFAELAPGPRSSAASASSSPAG